MQVHRWLHACEVLVPAARRSKPQLHEPRMLADVGNYLPTVRQVKLRLRKSCIHVKNCSTATLIDLLLDSCPLSISRVPVALCVALPPHHSERPAHTPHPPWHPQW